MRKALLTLFLLVSLASYSFSQAAPAINNQYSFITTGTTTAIPVAGRGISKYKIKVVTRDGTVPSACTVLAQISPDNSTWSTGISYTCTSDGESAITTLNTSYIRINVSALTRTQNTTTIVNLIGYIEIAGGNGVLAPDGSATAPSYAFNSCPTCGMYWSTDVINFSINGTKRALLGGGGLAVDGVYFDLINQDTILVRDAANVLAQKSVGNAQEFRVYGTTTGPKYLSLQHNGSSGFLGVFDDSPLYLKVNNIIEWMLGVSGDNYFFGPVNDNSVPFGKLDHRASNIFSALSTFGLATNSAAAISAGTNVYIGNDTSSVLTLDTAGTAGSGGTLQFLKSNNTQAARLIVASGDILGAVNFFGTAVAGTFQPAAQLLVKVDGTPGAGTDMPGRFELWTTPDGSATPALAFMLNSAKLLTLYNTTLLATGVTLTNGAAAQVATMTNGPVAGNPTKWIPINDNGTTRYFPAW